MELRLNVYKDGKIEKNYFANDFMLTTGLCEDVLDLIDIDKLTDSNISQTELGIEILKIATKSFSKFKPFIKSIFNGLTDEEFSRTNIKEVGTIIFQIVNYTITELFNVGSNSKN